MKSIFTSFPILFLAACLLLASADLAAQPCSIEQSVFSGVADVNATTIIGQTFTACGNGVITEIEVSVRDSVGQTLTFELFNADDRTMALDSQLVHVGDSGAVSVLLHEPFPVVDGQQYAFSFKGITVTDLRIFLTLI